MRLQKSKGFVFLILITFIAASCAGVQPPKPKVMLPPTSYPNSKMAEGVAVAAIPFDPRRDVYSDPNDASPRKPDFNWFKAGVCPTRFIFNSESGTAYAIDPSQITCKDANGTTYKAFDVREAGDAVVASEAFSSYVRGALAGALLGAALGAGLGAALGGAIGGARWAARGAAIGAASGGTQGMVLGAGGNRAAMEARVRLLLMSNYLQPRLLTQGITHDGIVYFPAVNIVSARIVLAAGANPMIIDIPFTLPVQDTGPPPQKEETSTEDTKND